MSLTKYKEKRVFENTPEPTGGKPTGKKLEFVIQKHHASHLHYDFRLELRGVLKSWAVPKGPSMNPSEKRLAMLVEDHPWDYKDFEGIIPSGYGKGTVIVWDQGKYETDAIDENEKKAQEHSITSQFWKGSINLVLHGKKIKGKFKIVRAKEKEDNAWYLWKVKDEHATEEDITLKEKSVLSKKTLEQVAANPTRQWKSHKGGKNDEAQTEVVDVDFKKGTKSPMPQSLSPMLCTLIKKPFNDEQFLYEVKWDGYRIMAFIKAGKVVLKSRGDQDYTSKYAAVAKALNDFSADAVIDGEVVVLDKNGNPDFSGLQNYRDGLPVAFYVFDLLWYNGYDLKQLPLLERKAMLQSIVPEHDIIKVSESFEDGIALFEAVKQMGLEGIVAKKKDSTYTPGKKGNSWYKTKFSKRQEYVIGGWTESDNGRLFRSLLFGHYVNGKFTYVHHSGGGFTDKQMQELASKLKKLEVEESPFVNKVDVKAKKHWAKPQLVAEFEKSTNTTGSGKIRHPAIFMGLRTDKKATDVVEEVAKTEPVIESNEDKTVRPKATTKTSEIIDDTPEATETGSWETIDKRVVTSENDLKIDKHKITLINIERELWPGITKSNVMQYYLSVADYMLPHLKDRPLGLNICLQSPARGGFFIRGMEGRAPKWADIFTTERKHKKEGKSNDIEWLVCNTQATLVYLLNLDTVDLHPWTSRTSSPNNPDYIVIDLDPSDDDFTKAVDTAKAAKQFFDEHRLKAFIKTSGKTGLHLLLPCNNISFGQSRSIAEHICMEINRLVPDITTTNVSVSSRGNLLYIDPNQNDYADRLAATYTVRAYRTPNVSTPLDWREVQSKLEPDDFNINNILKRLEKKGDLHADILNVKTRIANSKILKRFI